MAFPGVRSAVRAMMGGRATEQDAFNAEQRRLTAARSAGALMDRRVSQASMSGRQDVAQGELSDMLDMSDPNNVAIIAQLASQMNAAASSRATTQETDLQKVAIDAFNEGTLTPEISNAIQAIGGRGAFRTGTSIDPVGDSALNQTRVTALTSSTEALTDQRRKTFPDGTPRRQKVTDSRFQEFISSDEIGAFAAWMQDNKKDPELRDENTAIQRFRVLVDQGLLDPVSGQSISVMGGQLAGASAGATIETAIPSETLTEAPAPGTWIIVNGKPQKYLGQRTQ